MSKKLRRASSAMVEALENRQLLSAAVDVRLAGGGQTALVTTVGQTVNLELWVTVTGADADVSNEGLQFIVGSILSGNVSGGAANGTLAFTPTSPFNAAASDPGTQTDLDTDGDLDVGSNNNASAAGFFVARASGTITSGTANGLEKSFKVANGTFTVTSLLSGFSTDLKFRVRDSQDVAFLYQQDGAPKFPGTGTLDVGDSVVLKRSPGGASIAGRVFNDKNANGIFDGSDVGVPGFRVFLDEDNDGVLDSNETSKPVSGTGTYTFSNVVSGTYRVREVPRSGWRQTFPALGYYQVTIGFGEKAKSLQFANTDTVLIKGTVWMDADHDGIKDSGEGGLPTWTVYLDKNNNGVLDGGDQSTISDAKGNYRFFNIAAGTFHVRIVQISSKYRLTAPSGGVHNFTLAAGGTTSNKNFGEKRLK